LSASRAQHPVTSSGTPEISVTDTLANINADLATLSYESNDGGAASISITVVNQAGNADEQTISVNATSSGGGTPPGTTTFVNEASVAQSLSAAGTLLMVSNVAPWASASATNPIPTLVNGTTYSVIGTTAQSGYADLIFAAPVSAADGYWGANVAIDSSLAPALNLPVVTVGSCSDTLTLQVSEDAWLGDAQFTVAVDGTQIGGTLTAIAPHGGGDETFQIDGDFGAGPHTVAIDLLNGVSGGTAATQRDLYVDSASIDSSTVPNTALTFDWSGAQSFLVNVPQPAPPQPNGTVSFTDSSGNTLTQALITTGSLATYTGNGSGLVGNVYQWMENASTLAISTSYNLVTTANVSDTGGASLHLMNFVEADATLSGATQAPANLTIDTAKRGTIVLGTGNYNATVNAAYAGGTAAENTFNVTMGSGADALTLNGSSNITQAVVHAGSGTDVMTFTNTGAVAVYAGSGTDTIIGGDGGNTVVAGTGSLTVTGGLGADTYVWHAGSGLMTIANFNAEQGDALEFDASLKGTLQENITGNGVMLSFGTNTTDGVFLQGVSSVSPQSISWA
jgi:hypothetical protein